MDDLELGEMLARIFAGDAWVLLQLSQTKGITTLTNIEERELIELLRRHADALEQQSWDSRSVYDVEPK